MHRTVQLPLLVVLLASAARADCDYDEEWCCDPQTWCEAFHFAFYQFMSGLLFYAILITFLDNAKLSRLARQIIQSGRATSATVIAVTSKQVSSKDAPFRLYEYAALVEFPTLPRDTVLKWVKIKRASYEELLKSDLGRITVNDRLYPMQITETTLESLKHASSGVHELTIYSLTGFPKSAVSSDPPPSAAGLTVIQKIGLSFVALLMGGMLAFLFVWFASIYDYHLLKAGLKFVLLLVVQIASVGVVRWLNSSVNFYEKEKNWILMDTVYVSSKEVQGDGSSALGEKQPLLRSSIV